MYCPAFEKCQDPADHKILPDPVRRDCQCPAGIHKRLRQNGNCSHTCQGGCQGRGAEQNSTGGKGVSPKNYQNGKSKDSLKMKYKMNGESKGSEKERTPMSNKSGKFEDKYDMSNRSGSFNSNYKM